MKRLKKILAIGALAALPLAAVAASAQPAHASGVYIGGGPGYACDPYACGYYPPAGVYVGGHFHGPWHHW